MDELVDALTREMELRRDYLPTSSGKPVLETIYFGGGTPSLLTAHHLDKIFTVIERLYVVVPGAEITLEANPDDLTPGKLEELKNSPVNRLSIGVQSFFNEDLSLLHRVHDAGQAVRAVTGAAEAGFTNITIDLMYGLPGMSLKRWEENIRKALMLPVQHLSSYCLTVEKKTLLDKQIREGAVTVPRDEMTIKQFELLMDMTDEKGFAHYEISNFALPGFESRHNSSYWKNMPYLGIGPSAHSYNGVTRQWNISSNAAYSTAIYRDEVPATTETLTLENRYNEYVMTGLRTRWGVDLEVIRERFGRTLAGFFSNIMEPYIASADVHLEHNKYTLTRKGKLLADHIAASAFAT
jgi:oxygen-independent coproporphyrinogen-3 oxidase